MSWDPNADNTVLSLAVSGSTVYVGGAFSSIGGQTRNRIAALDASTGAAMSWNPNASNSVKFARGEREHGLRWGRLHEHRRLRGAGLCRVRAVAPRPTAPRPFPSEIGDPECARDP
jgi:hypothetical protein